MSALLDTDVGQMRLSAGYRSATTAAGRFAAPRQLGRGRRSGVLYALAAVENDPDEVIARVILQAVGQTFQRASGSLTARLRRAVQAGSTALFHENLDLTSGSLRGGGVACAVLRDDSLYLAQAGTAVACVCQRGSLICHPDDDLDDKAGGKAFGRRHDPHVRLVCHPVKPGDTAVLADVSLIRQVGDETLIQVLSVADASLSLDSLAAALSTGEGGILVLAMRGRGTATPVPSAAPVADVSRERLRAPPEPTPRPVEPSGKDTEPLQVLAPAGPTLAERLASVRQVAGSWLADARPVVGDWLRRLMPDGGPDHGERRATDRQPRRRVVPVDNRMWRTVALILPVIVLLVVAGTYWKRGWDRQARYTELMGEVERQLDVAATGEEATVRQALETALTTLEEAARSAPQDEEVSNLRADVQQQLDALNKVFRLQQVEHLHTYPSAGEVDEIVVHGTGIYVLDRLTDRVYHHRLNESRTALEVEKERLLVRKGDQPDTAAAVGDLVGMTWMSDGIGRLLILGRNGLLLTYDPAWERLTGTMLAANETWQYPVAVSSYRGRFYVLDPGLGQVLRYLASSGGDASPPERYFVEEEVDMAGAIDMAIDGFIYLLFDDGRLERYFAGKKAPMTLSLPDRPLHQPSAIYAAPDEEALFLYIADPSNHRVIRCDKEGHLVQQFLLEGNDALGQVRDIFVDELHDRLYFLSDNQLFLMHIPSP
jgi:hypothetical protein